MVVHDGALLVVRRANPPGRGLWSVPGGRVEPGESAHKAVERETAEETGVRVRCGALVGEVTWRGDGGPWRIANFHAEVVDAPEGHPLPTAGSDAQEARWVALGDVGGLGVVDGLLAFLERHGIVGPGEAGSGGTAGP